MNKKIIGGLAIGAVLLSSAGFAAAQSMNASPVAGTMGNSMMSINSNLSMGARGEDVVSLQTFLEEHGFLNLGASSKGYFGALTRKAVIAFQASVGLPGTGFFGELSRAKMSASASGSNNGNGGMGNAQTPNPMTKSADLRVLLNGLEHQHVDLASAATRSGFDGRPDFAAVAAELDKNSVALSKSIGSVYGSAAEARFLEIWRSHITFFVNYTVAAKKGDKPGMDKAVADLGGYVDAISDFFSGANPNLPREAVHQLVAQHVGLLKAAVDTYGAGDYTGSYSKQSEAYTQIGSIADAISGAVVKQYPEKF